MTLVPSNIGGPGFPARGTGVGTPESIACV